MKSAGRLGCDGENAVRYVESPVERKRDDLVEQMAELEKQQELLDCERRQIGEDAAVLEARICLLAREEAKLQQRKRMLQIQEIALGNRRSNLLDRESELDEVRTWLYHENAEVRRCDERTDREGAIEEFLKAASFQRAVSHRDAVRDDRREHQRLAVAVDVSLHTEHNFYMGLTENLSEGGLFIATYDDIPVGTRLEMSINLLGLPTIEMPGEVRWLREYTEDVAPGIGVRFLDMSENDKQAIKSFMARRDPLLFEIG